MFINILKYIERTLNVIEFRTSNPSRDDNISYRPSFVEVSFSSKQGSQSHAFERCTMNENQFDWTIKNILR